MMFAHKRGALLALCLVLLSGFLAGCGSQSEDTKARFSKESPADQQARKDKRGN